MSQVRVRFCPSPTGLPHVGLIRTCLFNYVHAKHTGGKFVFRIEDTDKSRDSEDSYNLIIEALKWLGLDWDEGIEAGGDDGPYRQSERYEIYQSIVQKLLDSGYAYKSFSTPEQIDQRNQKNGRPKQMGYDNYDRNLTQDEIDKFEADGLKPTIRFKMLDEDIVFHDLIRGEIVTKKGQVPDFVIMRANGEPLYTLTNPVDDALMGISCVLRGEDLLSSTPRQISLHTALVELGISKEIPIFGHLPYVTGEGNKKLSKRNPESNLFLHKERGLIPEGLVNYLALLGWSFSANEDIFTKEQLIDKFDVTKVLPNPARFDLKKCLAINAEHIRMLDPDDFMRRIVPYLHGTVSKNIIEMKLYQELIAEDKDADNLHVFNSLVSANCFDNLSESEKTIIKKASPLIQTRIQTLNESRDMLKFFFVEDDDIELDEGSQKQISKIAKNSQNEDVSHMSILQRAAEELSKIDQNDWVADNLHNVLQNCLSLDSEGNELDNSLNLKPRFAFTPLRVSISGQAISPPLFESMEILGKKSTLNRINNLICKLDK